MTAAQSSQPPLATPRRRHTGLSITTPAPNEDHVADVFRTPNLHTCEPHGQNPSDSIDRSLWKWARGGEYAEMPFIRAWVYTHSILMLVFAIILGWAFSDGPSKMVLTLLGVHMLIALRILVGLISLWLLSRRQNRNAAQDANAVGASGSPVSDHTEEVMHVQTADEARGNRGGS
ncbi:hypothetical protein BJX99DRAFT_224668 [Aspergillus californicus]